MVKWRRVPSWANVAIKLNGSRTGYVPLSTKSEEGCLAEGGRGEEILYIYTCMPTTYTHYFTTPLGTMEITATDSFITAVNFMEEGFDKLSLTSDPTVTLSLSKGRQSIDLPAVVTQCQTELEEYFAGKRTSFTVPVQPEGTSFQTEVWNALQHITYGETLSYTDIAVQLGKDYKASRAVGLANGKNPVAIIIPCHRVIGEKGKLTGYAGGAWRKEWLLTHEGKVSGKRLSLF